MPDPHESCARRQVTTTAPQALALLNGDWALDRAAAMAGQVLRETQRRSAGDPADPALARALVAQAYRRAFSRAASAEELARGGQFLDRQSAIIARRLAAGQPARSPTNASPAADRARAAALVDLC